MDSVDIKFAAYFETAPPTVVLKPDLPRFTIITANHAYLQVTGSSLEDLKGLGLLEAFPENPGDMDTGNVDALRDSLTRTVVNRRQDVLPTQKYDIPIRGTNQFSVRYWMATNSPILDEHGEVKYIILVTFDFTSAIQAAEKERFAFEIAEAKRKATQQLEERLSLAIDSAALGTWHMNLATTELVASARLKELFGFHADDPFSLHHAIRQIRADYREKFEDAVNAAITEGNRYDVEFPVIGFHDGQLRWLKATGKRFYGMNGRPGDFSGTVADITTARLEAEAERFKNTTLLQHSEEMAEMGSWEFDITTGKYVCSTGMYHLFAFEPGEFLVPEMLVPLAAEDQKHIAEEIVAKLQRFESFNQVIKIKKNGELRVIKIKSITLNNNLGELSKVLGVAMDITEIFQSQEKLKALNASLNTRNKELQIKNEELATFAFIASHDLREPLRKMATFSDFLVAKEEPHLSETGKLYLQRIKQSVHRMDLLIDDVLALAQLQSRSSKTEEVDLNKILQQAKEELKQQIEETGAIIKCEQLPVIRVYASPILSLFNNLINNAIKYRAKNRPPEINITCKFAGSDELPGAYADPGVKYYQLSFQDNGIGFDEKYSAQIFEIFKRLHSKKEYSGTGIGLALCKKIMENNQGFITAESKPGNGSVFHCCFPVL